MIFTAMILAMILLAKALLFVFPNLPEVPPALETFKDYTGDTVGAAAGILQMVFTTPLLLAITAVLIAIALFEQVYWLGLYIVKKIPFINIK